MSVAGNGAPASSAADNAPKQKLTDARVMDGLSSSKVTVEYHDPSGLFPLVQEQLSSKLPLRNLHWKSPTRPLRSIDSLHVDLVPSSDSVHISGVTSPGLAPPERTTGASTPTNSDHIRPPSKERRHQIPGLRQTPYLKVYLLRCDDSDTYKSTARKQLREWVKSHTPPSQSSSSTSTQENHDAYEWMIIHVVIPDTPAASQPRGSSGTASGEKEKSSATSRWTRGTTTILEKIRADFNITSKSGTDRVVQVRLQKDSVPPHMLPATPAAVTSPPVSESPQEQEKAWNEVITKFKVLILLSFDLRVRQYEEDIREKDSQRALPGWNFCTFFILKEGLARGFESVGLVEDALLGYDELSVGLDTVLRDQSAAGNESQGGVILTHSEDLYQQTAKILERSQKDDGGRKEPQPHIHDEKPINALKKDYRGLILSNNISAFDFRSYVFARQMSLLSRLGNSQAARTDLAAKLQPRPNAGVIQRSVDDSGVGTKSGPNTNDSEDLLSLAGLCTRALNFITFAGRLLRDDLIHGAKAHETTFPDRLIDNIVRSWSFAALEQVLRETSTSSLPFTKYLKEPGTGSSSKLLPFGNHSREQKISVAEQKSMIHPTRSSSLGTGQLSPGESPYSRPTSTGQVVFENGQYQDRSTSGKDSMVPQSKNGLQELASARAQLVVVQRRILEYVGKSLGWSIGWAAILPRLSPQPEELSDVDLDEKGGSDEESSSAEEEAPTEAIKVTSPTVGLSDAAIVNAVSSLEQFRQFYESLSDLIVKHYMAAGQSKSSESILGDLAALRFELGDFAAAAAYFGRMASLFAESRWNNVETTMLKMYAQCLKKLNRKDEYARTLLDLLAKSAADKKSIRSQLKRTDSSNTLKMPKDWLDDDKVDTRGVLQELVDFSSQLPYDMIASMPKYFSDITVEPYVRHYDEKDGFQLRLQFRHVLEDEVVLQKARVRLINATSTQGKEIWLETSEPVSLKKGVCRMWVGANVNTTGPYIADKIILETNRIHFHHEPFSRTETTPLGIMTPVSTASTKVARKSRIHCFPRTEAFRARVYLSHFLHIDQQRHIEIECSSGWNEIERAEIRLKSASAGLRLRTANAEVASGDVVIENKTNPGVLAIGAVSSGSKAVLKVPYELETMLPDLSIRLEVEYFTENGQFQYHAAFRIPIELPLDVNVHDHFKNDSLFSKFNIKTANHIPLEVLDVDLAGSDEFDVRAPKKPTESVHVFPKQPVAVTYKITKKPADEADNRQSKNSHTGSLALTVDYRCLNEDVLDRVRELFANAVENSPVHRLSRLLIETFADRMEHRVLPSQYEKIALLEKVDLEPFDEMGWTECIDGLPHIIRDDTRAWLQKWHETHKTIHLPKAIPPSPLPSTAPLSPNPPRKMIITVSIPQTHIVHTASLLPSTNPPSSSHHPTIATAGHPLMTTLTIKHTRRWASPASLAAAAHLASPSDPIDFVYTLDAHPDTWLVAGQRRAAFSAREGEVHSFDVMLIPMKTGAALLPNVEVRARVKPREEGRKSTASVGGVGGVASPGPMEGEEALSCEVDCLSYGEVAMVVPDITSSTVGIGEMGGSGGARGAVWLEGEGRVG